MRPGPKTVGCFYINLRMLPHPNKWTRKDQWYPQKIIMVVTDTSVGLFQSLRESNLHIFHKISWNCDATTPLPSFLWMHISSTSFHFGQQWSTLLNLRIHIASHIPNGAMKKVLFLGMVYFLRSSWICGGWNPHIPTVNWAIVVIVVNSNYNRISYQFYPSVPTPLLAETSKNIR